MIWCRYDNPVTMRRETWEDGKMTGFVTAELISSKGYTAPAFAPNTYLGDIAAVRASTAAHETSESK